jgi:prepilin-type N-terminal cleavage/methylation domain-containing protein
MHTPARYPNRGRGGFSLAELLIVLVIVGLVLVMAMPRAFNLVSALRARGAADQLAADIAYTRLNAVRSGRTASLTLAGTQYTIVVENTNGSTFQALRTVNLTTNYPGTAVTATGGTRLAFDSRGLLRPNGPSDITVSRGGRSQKLTVNAIGRVTRENIQ